MASSSLRRCPTNPTPRSFKSSAVNLGRTVSSILFSRNEASYCSRPSLRSQPPTSMVAPLARLPTHDPPGETACLGPGFERPVRVKLRRTQCEQISSGLRLKADITQYSRRVSKVQQQTWARLCDPLVDAVHAVSRRIGAHLRRTSIQRRGHLNHN